MSVTVCAKPRSFLPMILIGKSQGKASGELGYDGTPSDTASRLPARMTFCLNSW